MPYTEHIERQIKAERKLRAIGAMHAAILALTEEMGESEPYLEGLLSGRAEILGRKLTPAELEVAVAVAKRIPRDEIAEQRCVTKRNLEKQIPWAMEKLGFESSREFQGWIQGISTRVESLTRTGLLPGNHDRDTRCKTGYGNGG